MSKRRHHMNGNLRGKSRKGANMLGIISSVKLQSMPSSKRRIWRRRPGSNRMSFMSNTSTESKILADVEEEFLHASEFGDIPTVKRLLDQNKDLNVDCIDALGRTALRLAVKNEHLEIVEVLLDRSSSRHIYEAVLQAISAGHIQIAETILKHRRYLEMCKERKKLGDDENFFKTSFEESQFSPDISPLILAAQKNQYEIVQLLLLRGEIIHKPHKFRCPCQECTNKMKFDTLRSAKYRLNAYSGLASEAYISLSSKDPILTAFQLSYELKTLSRVEKYFKKEYRDLAEQLSEYVVRLLDRVRTQEELELILNKKGKPTMNQYESLARFKLALQYREKKFVAHPCCQQKLMKTWYHGIGVLERSSWPRRICLFSLFMFSYPFFVLVYLLCPKAKMVRFLHYPCVKFLSHMMSFLVFLLLIVVSTAESVYTISKTRSLYNVHAPIHEKYDSYRHSLQNTTYMGEDFPLRLLYPTITQFMITIYVLGFMCQECNQLYHTGLSEYVQSWYNLMDTALIALYFASFTLRYMVMIKGNLALNSLSHTDILKHTVTSKASIDWDFYWLNADRFYWDAWDPVNLAESLYAIANILSFARISYLLPANEALGPLQISLGRMIKDILKFLLLVIVVFGAFMVGLHNLFWYYSVNEKVEVTDHHFEFQAKKYFGDVLSTFRTVFFSLFGRGDTDVVTLGKYDNNFTEDTGYIIYGSYNVAMVIVLLNMLIAMMTRSFQNIAEDADTEWKFSRSILYMEYIGDGGTLPVPLNLLGGPRAFVRALWGLCCSCKSEDDFEEPPDGADNKTAAISSQDVSNVENGGHPLDISAVEIYETNLRPEDMDRRRSTTSLNEKVNYQKVIQTIIQRYIFDIQREAEVTEDDFEEIKQDISSFRYEMLNTMELRENEMAEVQEMLRSVLRVVKTLANDEDEEKFDFKRARSVTSADRLKFRAFVAAKNKELKEQKLDEK